MTETIPYTTIRRVEQVELRRYPETIFAVTSSDEHDSGFTQLFQYISGDNMSRRKIAMTAPVVTSEKIAMTAPVISSTGTMAFALPSSYSKETAPEPINPAVHIETRPPRTMGVMRFSGRATEHRVQEETQSLLTILQAHQIPIIGEPVLMRYNSPFTPGFLRHNEVAVDINEL
jgi:hypothetical protein